MPLEENRNPLRKLPRNVWAATATSFLTDVSSEMLLTLLPLFLANVLGTPTAVIGIIEGIAETTSSLLKLASGWLSDKLSTRKWLAVAGYGISAISKPFLYFTATWAGVLLVRFSDRVGKGIRTAPRDALIADSIQPEHRGLAFGLHRAGDTAGAVLGLTIALVVVMATQAESLAMTREMFQTLVIVSTIPALLAVGVLIGFAREVRSEKKSAPVRLSLAGLNPDFKYFLVVIAIFTLGNSSDAFLVLRAQERGLSVVGITAMLITFNVVYSVLSGPLGAWSDKIGRRRLIIGGWLAYGLIYLGFAGANTGEQIWLVYALYGIYYAAVEGTAKAYVADLVPSEKRGTAYGLYNAVVGLMALPASVLAGILWQLFGPAAPFVSGAVLALIAVGLLQMHRPGVQPSHTV
ncbi:MAG: MFS transporter [Anaerolineaceae bacterium]|nr:MFS transporter [Anaerolineaceae bacterium]